MLAAGTPGSQANVTDCGGASLADKRNIRPWPSMKVRLTLVAVVLVTAIHVSRSVLVWTKYCVPGASVLQVKATRFVVGGTGTTAARHSPDAPQAARNKTPPRHLMSPTVLDRRPNASPTKEGGSPPKSCRMQCRWPIRTGTNEEFDSRNSVRSSVSP